MLMFWDRVYTRLNLGETQRYVFGSLFLIYAVIRFLRFFKEDEDDEK